MLPVVSAEAELSAKVVSCGRQETAWRQQSSAGIEAQRVLAELRASREQATRLQSAAADLHRLHMKKETEIASLQAKVFTSLQSAVLSDL